MTGCLEQRLQAYGYHILLSAMPLFCTYGEKDHVAAEQKSFDEITEPVFEHTLLLFRQVFILGLVFYLILK